MYYRLFDKQTGNYMHTGYNCKTKKDLKNEIWDYLGPDREEIFLTYNQGHIDLNTLLEVCDFMLESSKKSYGEHPEFF